MKKMPFDSDESAETVDEVEGHRAARAAVDTEEDDVEGHRYQKQ
jgi:hypothetical protein